MKNSRTQTLSLVSISANLENGFYLQDYDGNTYHCRDYFIDNKINDCLSELEGRTLAFEAGKKFVLEELALIKPFERTVKELHVH